MSHGVIHWALIICWDFILAEVVRVVVFLTSSHFLVAADLLGSAIFMKLID